MNTRTISIDLLQAKFSEVSRYLSIKAVDGHGVDSVSDMFGNGGLTVLELVEELWIGDFNIPETLLPERNDDKI